MSKARGRATKAAPRRGAPTRKPRPYVLIVCEGAKTEPNYFDAFRTDKHLSRELIKIVPGDVSGNNPKSIVEYAKRRMGEARKEGAEYDEVWCVFDCDEHERLPEAFVQARANGMKVAFSNPCFELWFLLHFEYHSAPVERDVLVQKLKCHLPGYSKSSRPYFELQAKQATAIQNAKKLRIHHGATFDDNDAKPNPSTTADDLVIYLSGLTKAAIAPRS